MRAERSTFTGFWSAVVRRARVGRLLVLGFTAVCRFTGVRRCLGFLFTEATFGFLLFLLLLSQLSLLLLEAVVRAFRHCPSACIRLAPSRVETAQFRTGVPRELRSGGVRRPGP